MPSQPEVKPEKAKEQSKPIEPSLYNSIIEGLIPVDLTLKTLSFKLVGEGEGLLNAEASGEPATLLKGGVKSPTGHISSIQQKVTFKIEGSDQGVIADGVAIFVVRVQTKSKPPTSFWNVFLRRNVPLYINPAVRDLVASLSARANLQTRLLPSIPVVPFAKPKN